MRFIKPKRPALLAAHTRRSLFIVAVCLVPACTDANHFGNPLTLPVSAITNAAENGAYNRERAQVKAWIAENEVTMRAEGFRGPVTDSLLETLPPEASVQANADLIDSAAYPDFVERATVVVMVHKD